MAVQMMLEYLGEMETAGLVERAVMKVIKNDMKSMDAGKMGMSTTEVGDMIAKYIQDVE